MPHVSAKDGTRLYYEEAGSGTPILFVHEFAGDYRTWEPQMERFSRSYRCITFSQRGYPPSDIPQNPDQYLQDIYRDDIIALMDGLKIDKAHIVSHSMGASTSLHVGIHYPNRCLSMTVAGCGYGSNADPKVVADSRAVSRANGKMFREHSMAEGAKIYCDGATRHSQKWKDPRGYAHFVKLMSEHSNIGHAMVMENLQTKRPTLWDIEAGLKKFAPPLLIIVGDEDDWCVDASVFLRRTVPVSGLVVIPRTGHTVTSEEPDKFNAAVAEFLAAVELGKWGSHKPPKS